MGEPTQLEEHLLRRQEERRQAIKQQRVWVGCCATKLSYGALPLELYQGDLFKLHVRYALLRYGFVGAVLSAKHDVLDDLWSPIEPYDERVAPSGPAHREWSARIAAYFDDDDSGGDGEIVVLAGAPYYSGWCAEAQRRGWTVTAPFAGMRIGERKRALIHACEEIKQARASAIKAVKDAGLRLVEDEGHYWRRFDVFNGWTKVYGADSASDLIEAVRSAGVEFEPATRQLEIPALTSCASEVAHG